METYHAVVQGLVQGVCFRAWTRDMARGLGLKGWVRNLPDGTVETMAQGPRGKLERFARQLETGAPLSRVSAVRGDYTQEAETFSSFDVRY